jgi:threonine/homoserine/homoserine lactone efflux protein
MTVNSAWCAALGTFSSSITLESQQVPCQVIPAARRSHERHWMLLSLLIGFVAAFVGSIPVAGPISVLVLQRGLEGDRRGAIAIAVGSAIAEMVYAGLAFAGVSTLLTKVPVIMPIVRGIGAAILVGIGIYFVVRKKHAAKKKRTETKEKDAHKWLLGLSITALNPTLFISWTVVITTLHGAGLLPPVPRDAFAFALGVGCGVVVWFLALGVGVQRFRRFLRPATVARGVRVMGYVLIVAGVAMGVRAVALPLLTRHV